MTYLSGTFIRYLAVGALNFLVCIIVMRLGSQIGLSYLYYTFFGYFAAMTHSFFLNAYVTFQYQPMDKKQRFSQLTRFFVINGFNLALVELLEYVLIEKLFFIELAAVLIGMVVYTLIGFYLNQRWVFSSPRQVSS